MATNFAASIQRGGYVDWDALAASADAWSLGHLSRLSAVNIDPYSLQLGELVTAQFRLSASGARNASNGCNNLALDDSSSLALCFGFDLEHIIRDKTENTGFVFLVICGALMEYYHEDFLPHVFHEMAIELGCPPGLILPKHHWKSMLHALNGAIANTQFGLVIDAYVRLDPHRGQCKTQMGNGAAQSTTRFGSMPASPRSIARALTELGRLSRGEIGRLAILGSEEAGFFAALAEWLLGMRVAVRSESGEVLSDRNGHKEPEVIVVFTPGTHSFAATALQQMHIDGAVCRLNVDGGGQAADATQKHLHPVSPGGRLDWHSMARDFYGSDFMGLMKTEDASHTYGIIVGCAARIIEGIFLGSKDDADLALAYFSRTAGPESYGTGFVQTLINYFPGMSKSRSRMEKTLRLSLADAEVTYDKEIQRLGRVCQCSVCTVNGSHSHQHCLVVIVESTITLSLLLANTIVAPGIYPKRSGMQGFYQYWAEKRQTLTVERHESDRGPRFKAIYRDALGLRIPLSVCLCLFTSTNPDVTDPLTLAYSCNGMVAYSDVLHGMVGKRKPSTSITVMAGVIQYQGRVYRSIIADGPVAEKFRNHEIAADQNAEYEIIEPDSPAEPLVLRLKACSTVPIRSDD